MTLFEAGKSRVSPVMAAEHYGLQVGQNGMACCPFHPDRHPSMKLYGGHYTTLLLCGRLDLTMEHSVCKPEYQALFTQHEISYCKSLLDAK